MSEEMDRLVAEFEKFQTKLKQAEAQFAKVGDMQEELNALEAQVMSPDRAVTVVAGPSGSVKDLRLSPDALRQQPDQLAATILATLHQAVAESARKQANIVDEHVGTAFGLNVSEQVLEAQAAGLGTTVEELESNLPEAQPQRPATPIRDEEDFANNNLLRTDQRPAQAPPPPPPASAGDQFLKNLFNDEEDHR
ncbi:YbaB/EbfC family nucleoid-associated protein [Amycolatopsis sp. VS8301801F10]|uniref:YbaB/EbfC family nucleoid-associated protein n=1 Tax=Amycolatopsis sp. VS8301801F10 TaxID=2652442 RepID=UPI0038FC4FB9